MTSVEPLVVVVAYGHEDQLEGCLRPLAGRSDVVVVDNAQRAACASLCRSLGVRYVDPGGNLGFGAAVNLAVRQFAADRDVLLLNPDAALGADDVVRLQDALRAEPRVAAVAPTQRHPGTGHDQRVAWPFPTPGRQWAIAVGLGRRVTAADFVVGSALLLRAEALREVGPFDERFFLYAEETDWQRRARDHGWSVRLVDDVHATHEGAGTSESSALQQAYFHAGTEIYVRKWHGRRGWALYRGAMIAGDAVRSLAGGRTARGQARARLRIELEGPVRHRDRLLRERAG